MTLDVEGTSITLDLTTNINPDDTIQGVVLNIDATEDGGAKVLKLEVSSFGVADDLEDLTEILDTFAYAAHRAMAERGNDAR